MHCYGSGLPLEEDKVIWRIETTLLLMVMLAACSKEPGYFPDEEVAQAARSANGCAGFGGSEHDPCRISMYSLIVQPAIYEGVYVQVTGMYVEGLDRVLFTDRDSAENSILKNGIFISTVTPILQIDLDRHRNKFVTLSGVFSSVARSRSEFGPRDFSQFSGTIQVDRIGNSTSAPIPYACWNPSRDRSNDPRTVKELLGEVACEEMSVK